MRPSSADTSEPACVKRKMLSMKSSTSCPSSSRKYSATVSPVRPTRRRAPGGRSEEHTSELQSLRHIVCRFLIDTGTTEIYSLSLHDALPICSTSCPSSSRKYSATVSPVRPTRRRAPGGSGIRSEEHTSELQSLWHLVCRL